ncbi:glycoside hydrolase family 13 protein [Zasmidium cellare ATCC 36951]|uniref:Glycoside hydrolase family 13 protein n=1 Tax=Zasmidium cellare ATCC 36951 TaxID=1080233 RepID=A0A6A6CYP1_ZASCE|nr:glycoside hydrolase family 13 protein [Zasmidium cellare ATCC 36951]KAF2171863.1 glycoside hydrolase family 13 protein [Zasmidium cellare ATCC 36951]
MSSKRHWWHNAAIYEAYPASFKDSNGDGIGDIPGLISKVEYLANLGVDAVWLAACYRSSGVDMGYDVVDYRDVDPQYGTVEDIEKLIAKLKEHGMKLIMDLVVNHTSDEHAWFKESRSSLKNPKRDWYFWRKGITMRLPDGTVERHPPNNWESIFRGSAWEYDERTDEYYLRIFSKQQPDLNWDNPKVRKAVYSDMRFWLEKGVAGFRMDVINMISKPDGLPDAPVKDSKTPWQNATALCCNGPRVHEFLKEMRKEALDPYGDQVMTVGEVICTDKPADVRAFTDPDRQELNMVYTYDLFGIDMGSGGKFDPRPWTLSEFKHDIIKWQNALAYSKGAWQTTWLESHDSARCVTRFGDKDPKNRTKVAKMLALLQSTFSGTFFLYQGQEIGMINLDPSIPLSEYKDLETHQTWASMRAARAAQHGVSIEDVDMAPFLTQVHLKARDHARAPLPWTASSPSEPHAGFSSAPPKAKTWSPMNTDSATCNITSQLSSPSSVLNYYRHRLSLRKKFGETVIFGDFEAVEGTLGDGGVFAYWRKPLVEEEGKARGKDAVCVRDILVVLNLGNGEGVEFKMPKGMNGGEALKFFVLDDTYGGEGAKGFVGSGENVVLGAFQGVVFGY